MLDRDTRPLPHRAGRRTHADAMAGVVAEPRAHRPRLVTGGDIRPQVHGGGPVGRFNSWLAVLITRAVGTMWAGYLFAAIAFISLPQAAAAFARGDTLAGVTWLSQSFLQLVLLPIIIVGQNVASATQDARAEADHETLTALHVMNVQQLEILERQERILERTEKRS
jgi:hypothetical protein